MPKKKAVFVPVMKASIQTSDKDLAGLDGMEKEEFLRLKMVQKKKKALREKVDAVRAIEKAGEKGHSDPIAGLDVAPRATGCGGGADDELIS